MVSVTLFGSKAIGRDDAESDIDLLVLTSRKLNWRERAAITDALFDVEMANDVVISTLVLPAEEWENGPYRVLPIRDEINREGVTNHRDAAVQDTEVHRGDHSPREQTPRRVFPPRGGLILQIGGSCSP